MEGINDIGNARSTPIPTAEDLIAAHTQLIERAHAKGVKVIGATLTPFWGAGYYTEVGEAKRQALNSGSGPAAATTASPTSTGRRAIPTIRRSCSPPTTPAITCTRTTPGSRRWRTPSTWRCFGKWRRDRRALHPIAAGPVRGTTTSSSIAWRPTAAARRCTRSNAPASRRSRGWRTAGCWPRISTFLQTTTPTSTKSRCGFRQTTAGRGRGRR